MVVVHVYRFLQKGCLSLKDCEPQGRLSSHLFQSGLPDPTSPSLTPSLLPGEFINSPLCYAASS